MATMTTAAKITSFLIHLTPPVVSRKKPATGQMVNPEKSSIGERESYDKWGATESEQWQCCSA